MKSLPSGQPDVNGSGNEQIWCEYDECEFATNLIGVRRHRQDHAFAEKLPPSLLEIEAWLHTHADIDKIDEWERDLLTMLSDGMEQCGTNPEQIDELIDQQVAQQSESPPVDDRQTVHPGECIEFLRVYAGPEICHIVDDQRNRRRAALRSSIDALLDELAHVQIAVADPSQHSSRKSR